MRDGVIWSIRIWCLTINSLNNRGSRCAVSGAMMTLNPLVSGNNVSSPKISKEMVVKAKIDLAGLKSIRAVMPADKIMDRPVLDHHPFGFSGGTGGIDDVG